MSVNWGDLPLEVVNQILKIHEDNELRWWIETMENHKKQGDTLCPITLRHTRLRGCETIGTISPSENGSHGRVHPEWIHQTKRGDKVVRGEEKRMIELYVNRSRIVRHLFGTIQERRGLLERQNFIRFMGDGVYETPTWIKIGYDCYEVTDAVRRIWDGLDEETTMGEREWVDGQMEKLMRTPKQLEYKVDAKDRKVVRDPRSGVGTNNPDLVFKIRNRQEMEDIAEKEKKKFMGFGKGKTKCSRCGLIGHTKNNALCPALSDQKFGVVMNFTTDE